MRILIATSNAGKLREISAVMSDLPVEWSTLVDHPALPVAIEDGATFAENAAKKARHYSRLTGMWALADDSGLVVDALGGLPGVRSARFSDTGRDDDNNAKLIEMLRDTPDEQRTARFVCCLALHGDDEVLATAEGVVEGRIVDQPKGRNGFGYDPHFWLPDRAATTAELPPQQKNRISHRGKALRLMAGRIRTLLATASDSSHGAHQPP